jgi:Uma2 family endonuclease
MTLTVASQRKKPQQVQPYRWTRQEYEKMTEIGLFSTETRLELIEGEILEMVAQTSYHVVAVLAVQERLAEIFRVGYNIRMQMPLALNDDSEPEPDIAVVAGASRDYWHKHPTTSVLIVEVAYSSLGYDQERKRRLYARAFIPEYWILNLSERRLEVYREPENGDYVAHLTRGDSDTVAPLAYPDQQIEIADFLPR